MGELSSHGRVRKVMNAEGSGEEGSDSGGGDSFRPSVVLPESFPATDNRHRGL